METISCATLITADLDRAVILNPGDTLELTRVEFGQDGQPTAWVLVPFTGPAIRLVLQENAT